MLRQALLLENIISLISFSIGLLNDRQTDIRFWVSEAEQPQIIPVNKRQIIININISPNRININTNIVKPIIVKLLVFN